MHALFPRVQYFESRTGLKLFGVPVSLGTEQTLRHQYQVHEILPSWVLCLGLGLDLDLGMTKED